MNLITLRASLAKHEGEKNTPYLDSVGVWTVGIGHNMSNPLSKEVIDHIFSDDINTAISELDRVFHGWRNHNDTRQNVLIELCFNLGAPRLKKFTKFWAAMDNKNYVVAAAELVQSHWAVQVGKRSKTLSDQIKNG